MSALDAFRTEVRALLGPAPFLRRDLAERALFITDAPRRLDGAEDCLARLTARGYRVEEARGLWRIDLSPARQAAFIRSLSPGDFPRDPRLRSLCRSLLSRDPCPPEQQPWPPIRQTLLLLDAGDLNALCDRLCADAALRKRAHAPLPAAAASLIMNAVKEVSPC